MKQQSMRYFYLICASLAFALILLVCPSKEVLASSDEENVPEIKIAYQTGGVVEAFSLEPGKQQDLRFLGAPSDWRTRNLRWISSNPEIASVDDTGLVTAHKEGSVMILLFLEPYMSDAIWVHVEPSEAEELPLTDLTAEAEPEEPEELSPKQETPVPNQLVLRNQEAIVVPNGAAFSDGTKLSNIRDIANWAFSYMLTDGTRVIPTYEGSKTGVAEIVDVTYRANSRAKSVIIQSVIFKVYIDTNDDGWVTTEEKTIDAIGYYYVIVDVDKTITVEDWSIVTK